jgi:hypothetical protein
VTHEKGEQSKLGRGQRKLPTGTGGEPVFFIDEQPLDLQDLRDRASPAQDSPHARHQLERKRLHQVIVGAQLESGDPVGNGAAGCEKNDRQLTLLPEQRCQLKAVAARQQQIKDRQIGRDSEHVYRRRRTQRTPTVLGYGSAIGHGPEQRPGPPTVVHLDRPATSRLGSMDFCLGRAKCLLVSGSS